MKRKRLLVVLAAALAFAIGMASTLRAEPAPAALDYHFFSQGTAAVLAYAR
jgi:hypothetical protein